MVICRLCNFERGRAACRCRFKDDPTTIAALLIKKEAQGNINNRPQVTGDSYPLSHKYPCSLDSDGDIIMTDFRNDCEFCAAAY
jgi:hypothetical protein